MTNDLPKDVISIETAQNWQTNWNENGAKYLSENPLKAFLIPGDDIKGIIKNDHTFHIRGYLGLQELDGSFIPHMMVVGVDKNGNDMVDYNKELYIYDFTSPCPNTCSKEGPFVSK